MNGIYKEIYVSKKEPVVIEIAQGSNAVPLIFAVKDWDVPQAATASFYIEKPSGALIFDAATIDGNEITVPMTTQMTAETGLNKCQLMVVESSSVLYSFVILMKVFETIVDDSAIESQDEFTALEEALSAVSDVVTHSEVASTGSAYQGVYFNASGLPVALSSRTLRITTPSFSELPATFYNADITANHRVVNVILSSPSAQVSDWTVTTAAGNLVISGSISGSTTATIDLDVMDTVATATA